MNAEPTLKLDPEVVSFVREAVADDRYGAYLRKTIRDLVAINTAPEADLAATASRERALFDFISGEVRRVAGDGARVEWCPIAPEIARDPAYSPPGYAADAEGRVRPVEEVYAERGNLIVQVPGTDGDDTPTAILHAHVDVVPPWFPVRTEGERVFGRGACDNKAQVALLLAQIMLLREIETRLGRRPARGRVYQFVIDEEIGGNGSLSMTTDVRFRELPVLVHECTNLVPYCAHRGAVWYRCVLEGTEDDPDGGVELFPFVVLALEEEGRKLREETEHPLFTAAHVQTSHGILGPYGSSPAVVCDHVAIELTAVAKAHPIRYETKLTELLEAALATYVRDYGDKTRERDPATGELKVRRHFDTTLLPSPSDLVRFRIDVYGRSGHLAGVRECDGAITKAAYLLGALLRVAGRFPGIAARGRLADTPEGQRRFVLEGGQGFTPSHRMSDVQERLRGAARRGAEEYCRVRERTFREDMVYMTFDRLHNDAYADSPDAPPMRALHAAMAALGERIPEPVGWETSCDARIYHHKGHPVAIFGAGELERAHSADESVRIPDVQKALAISTLAAWVLTA